MAPLWLLWLLSAPPADVASIHRELAAASVALLEGDPGAVRTLERLHEARPWDDDVAYWLARARYEAERCPEAAALLLGRDGEAWPAWRLRTLEAYARVCMGEPERARALLEAALPQIDDAAEARRASAALGLLLLAAGLPDAARHLIAAGGDPALALDPLLARGLPRAIGVPVLGALRGALTLRYGGEHWRLDLSSGLGRPVEPPEPPGLSGAAPARRSEVRPCGDGVVWTSPEEPLFGGAAGVFAREHGRDRAITPTPPGAVDDSPSCAGDAVWLVRTLGGRSDALLVQGGKIEQRSLEVAITSLDARPDGALVLGVVVGDRPAVWAAAPGQWPPGPLLGGSLPLVQPRWSP